MNYYAQSSRDFNRKFCGSVVRLDGMLYKHEDSAGDNVIRHISGMVLDRVWTPYSRDINSRQIPEIDASFPKLGYARYKRGTIFLTRKANRQWNVGYNRGVISVQDRFINERRVVNSRIVAMANTVENTGVLKHLFSPTFMSYNNALDIVRSGEAISVPLSLSIAIGQSVDYDGLVICYKEKVVGTIGRDNIAHLHKLADYISLECPFNVVIDSE